jgi:hypothetical protein
MRSVVVWGRDRRLELLRRHPALLDRVEGRIELFRRRTRDALDDVAEVEVVSLRDVLDHLGGDGMALERVLKGPLALLQAAVDEQPEDRSDEQYRDEDEGEHGADPCGTSPEGPELSSATGKQRDLDTPSRARYGGTVMSKRRNGGWRTLAVAVLLVFSAAACRQPRPTYEYGETETTITTTPPPAPVVTTSTLAPKSPAWKRGEAR